MPVEKLMENAAYEPPSVSLRLRTHENVFLQASRTAAGKKVYLGQTLPNKYGMVPLAGM
jgi:hypothetical protein